MGSPAAAPLMHGVWSAQDTTPSEIDAALRELLKERHAESASYVPARVLNLIVIVDREWRGEIENRLERVGRYHPSRTILCAVEPGRTTLSAQANMTDTSESEPGGFVPCRERVVIEVGPQHLPHLDSIVDALVVTDLSTVVWSPHGHPEAVDALMKLTQVVLLDSLDEPDVHAALRRSAELAKRAYVVDLAWLRSTPWRERIAGTFDPPPMRRELHNLSAVKIRHRPDSAVPGLLLIGWLASRLGWDCGAMIAGGDGMRGRARASKRHEVSLELQPAPQQSVPGLAGLTLETASGMSLSLDRGAGGLEAVRKLRDGSELRWSIMGASRGESGILGEGIRQALLRDPTYGPALTAAEALVG
ncbi:MAG TPA: glucose-6-phosphate dehydrogenase assembly protein OpcA [Solirubrobacteraceae bacterium]|nr:glucose-6-phosphate dehydrogenase assembly protein OpcA [Solirubrobacteraceae bacterium]